MTATTQTALTISYHTGNLFCGADTEGIDIDATLTAYETQVRAAIAAKYPDVEFERLSGEGPAERYYQHGERVEDDTAAWLDAMTEWVFSAGTFWPV